MRRALLIVLLAACGEGPDDLFVISGQTASPDGSGLGGVQVSVFRSRPEDQMQLRSTVTPDGGAFSFDLVRAEVESLSSDDVWWTQVWAQFSSGTIAWTELAWYPQRVELPPFYDWRPGVTIDGGVVRFTPIVPADGECEGRSRVVHAVTLSTSQGTLWEQSDVLARPAADGGTLLERAPIVLTDDMLEDGLVTFSLRAKRVDCDAPFPGLRDAPPYRLTTSWWGAAHGSLTGTRRAVSRGARCPEVSPSGGCHLTDGSMNFTGLPRPTTRFRLELAAPASIRTVLLRFAVSPLDLPPATSLTARAGGDELTVPLSSAQVVLDDATGLGDGSTGRVEWTRVVLPRALRPSPSVELELDTPLVQLGELSLFEE